MSDPDVFRRENSGQPPVVQLFTVAQHLDPSRRELFLDFTKAYCPETVAQVEKLLITHGERTREDASSKEELESEPVAEGELIGKWKVERILSITTRSVVYEVKNRLGGSDALKLLSDRPHQSAMTVALTEGKNLVRLKHKRVVNVSDVGEHNGQPFLVMEFIAGPTLADVLQREESFSLNDRFEALIQLCDAVSAIHKLGYLHGDVKPQNIILEGRSTAAADETALTAEGPGTSAAKADPMPVDLKLIDLGSVVRIRLGTADREITPGYVPPWLVDAQHEDAAALSSTDVEIYALGTIFAQLFSIDGAPDATNCGRIPSWRRKHAVEIYNAATKKADGDAAIRFDDVRQFSEEVRRLRTYSPSSLPKAQQSPFHRLRLWVVRKPYAAFVTSLLVIIALAGAAVRELWVRDLEIAFAEAEYRRNLGYAASDLSLDTSLDMLSVIPDLREGRSPQDEAVRELYSRTKSRMSELADSILTDQHPDVRTRDLAFKLGAVFRKMGEFKTAESLLRHCIDAERPIQWNAGSTEAQWRHRTALGRIYLAEVLLDKSRTMTFEEEQKSVIVEAQKQLESAHQQFAGVSDATADAIQESVLWQRVVDGWLMVGDLDAASSNVISFESAVSLIPPDSMDHDEQLAILFQYKGEISQKRRQLAIDAGNTNSAEQFRALAEDYYRESRESILAAHNKDPNNIGFVANLGRNALHLAKVVDQSEAWTWFMEAERWTSQYRASTVEESAILELWGVWFRMIRAADSATEQTRLLQKLDEDFQELEDQGLISEKARDFYSRIKAAAVAVMNQKQ